MTDATPDAGARRRAVLQHLMVMSRLMARLPPKTLSRILVVWVVWALALLLPLPDVVRSTFGIATIVVAAAMLAAVLLEWAARLALDGRDFASELAGARLSRLTLRVCALVVLAGLFTTLMLLSDDRYLLERRIVVAAMLVAIIVGVSIAVRFRRRRLAAAEMDPAQG